MPPVPSSHGSLDPEADEAEVPPVDPAEVSQHTEEDGFDSEEFRQWVRERRERRQVDGRGRRGRRGGGRDEDDVEDSSAGKGGGPQPPEWDGQSSFQDWLIKARLWLATTRYKPCAQGPIILQRLSGQPFQSLKHYANDARWLKDDRNGHKLLDVMDTPELFGEDREEELLASLSKLTYHIRRNKDETCRAFFTRWDDAVRKTQEHKVSLPDKYLGFLLVNALNLSEQEIKGMLAFSQGSILVRDVKNWCRKHETKLLAKDVGSEKVKTGYTKGHQVLSTQHEDDDQHLTEEIMAMDELLRELQGDGDGSVAPETVDDEPIPNDEILEEHEAKEILSTMIAQRKKTFMQSLKTKKAKTLARGFGNWRDKSSSSSVLSSNPGYVKGGFYRMSLREAKNRSTCSRCLQVGHWHKDPECPKNQTKTKEVQLVERLHEVESEEGIFCGLAEIVGHRATSLPDGLDERGAEEVLSGKVLNGPEVFECTVDVSSSQQVDETGRLDQSNFDRAYKDQLLGESDVVNSEGDHEDELLVYWNSDVTMRGTETPDDQLCATIDTGCQRMAIGLETLRKLNDALPQGLQTSLVRQEHRFRSVHGTSKTSFVAVIPTSLGNKGSLLRPAVFDTPESSSAPFLISLPFLLHCRAVLCLDESLGLKIHFRKFGFTVKCHLGPTGALRVPLSEFDKRTLEQEKNAQEQWNQKHTEYEVLRTDAMTEESQQIPDRTRVVPSSPQVDDCDDRHGVSRSDEAPAHGRADGRLCRADDSLAPPGYEDPLSPGADDRVGGPHAGCPQDATEGQEALLTLAPRPCARGDSVGDCGEHGRILTGGGTWANAQPTDILRTERQPEGQCISSQEHGVNDINTGHSGQWVTQQGRVGCDGDPANMLPRRDQSSVHDTQGRTELLQDILALSPRSRNAMRLLPVDPVSANVAASREPGDFIREKDTALDPNLTESGSYHTGTINDELYKPMQASEEDTSRIQRICGEREVSGLRRGSEVGAQEGCGDPFHEQPGSSLGAQRCRGGSTSPEYQEEGDQGSTVGDGGLPGVPAVPQVDERYGQSPRASGIGRRGIDLDPQEIQRLAQPVSKRRTKRMNRVVRQATTALREAESMWQEVMNLVQCTEPDACIEQGWQAVADEVLDHKNPDKPLNHRKLKKFAAMLDIEPDQLRTVAEIFNPKRFGNRAKKHQLMSGEAFDLALGQDLLDPKVRQEVRSYITMCKPGLTVISPPCIMYSLLQNLSQPVDAVQHLRRLREAKLLLRFAIEIAKIIMSYGGDFVFEHPLTSRAWLDKEMQHLIQDDRVLMVATDQCQFGLRSDQGGIHKKSTGFLTTNPYIVKELDRRCDGQHEHEQILGKVNGVNRSRRAQEYPQPLVDAILRGYQRGLQRKEPVHWIAVQDLQRERAQRGRLSHEVYLCREVGVPRSEKVINETYPLEDGEEAEEEENGAEDPEGELAVRERLPRERPFSLEQLVRRAHEGLGHCGNERLARILKSAKASDEAIRIARNLKCSVCHQHAELKPARRAAPPRQLHVNEVVGIDSVYLPSVDGGRRLALNIVDWSSRFQMIIPLKRHTASEARRGYLQWVKFFGPPTKLYPDLGREFKGAFELGAELDSTILEPSALEMPTQRGITERAGRSFKEVLSRTMMNYACRSEEEWEQLVDIANMTCNRLMNKSGYSPIQRVLGYTPRIPGGLLTGGANDLATQSRSGGDVQVQRAHEMRLAASKAFHDADCSQALINALHAGHRPRLDYEVGQVVYFWRKGMEGARKNSPDYWRGPARVILTSPPSTVWLNFQGYVVKAAPEHLRLASEEEHFGLSDWMEELSQTREELERQPRKGYLDLTDQPFPTTEPEEVPEAIRDQDVEDREKGKPRYRLVGKRDKDEVVYKNEEKTDEWLANPNRMILTRYHENPRRDLFDPYDETDFHDSPIDKENLTGSRRTYGKYVHTGENFVHVDDWTVTTWNDQQRNPWTGYTEFDIRPEVPYRQLKRTFLETDETKINGEEEEITKRKKTMSEEPEQREPEILQPPEEEVTMENEEQIRGEVRQRDEEDEREEPGSKRMRTEFLDIFLTSVEKMMASKMKKEVNFRKLETVQREKFVKAISKEIKNNLETQAYEALSPEESEKIRRESPNKIVTSRFVLTEKSIEPEDIDKARTDGVLIADDGENSTKAKARHVMKGFSEDGAEDLETTTPQCGRETVLCTLQLICSHKWVPGYLDFTQAFHSGDKIERELYASQPPECPLPGYNPRQLLRLLKTCYGLLDGPYAWYQHLHRVLTEMLGYTQSAGDPCFFHLRHPDTGHLEGVISVATDDLLHGGGDLHWQKMRWLNENYKLGKFSTGDGRFVGKEIRCRPDGSFLLHQPLFAKKIQSVKISKDRKKEKYSFCTEEEISSLRGLLGSLSWLAKETRPDLAGRVAILQQSMPRPYIQDLIEANSLAKEANEFAEIGVTIHPIPLQHLRVGTITDASWGNVKPSITETELTDYWEEKSDRWIRHHLQPRRLRFHPSSQPGGPNAYELNEQRTTIADGREHTDVWNRRNSFEAIQEEAWCGQTIFFKKKVTKTKLEKVNEKFLQQEKLSSQGGYLTFFYDARMETLDQSFPISIVNWKSFRIKRCTVNTLSAECQAMLQGVGSLHWLRFLLRETNGEKMDMETWEEKISQVPYIAITDSKSLYDTIQKCCNTGAHIEDKRTAIDVTILKRDFRKTQGQVRWVEGTRMVADSLTKKMGSSYLRKILTEGRWSLTEKGFEQQGSEENSVLFLIR